MDWVERMNRAISYIEAHITMSIVSAQTPPEQMVKMDFPEATWAVFEAEGGPEENKNELWVAVVKK